MTKLVGSIFIQILEEIAWQKLNRKKDIDLK